MLRENIASGQIRHITLRWRSGSPGMGAEDMAYLLQRTRGSFCILGSGKKDGNNEYPHHHPRFDIDEDVLWIGPALFVQLSLDLYDEMIR